jgi:hypothetical protein
MYKPTVTATPGGGGCHRTQRALVSPHSLTKATHVCLPAYSGHGHTSSDNLECHWVHLVALDFQGQGVDSTQESGFFEDTRGTDINPGERQKLDEVAPACKAGSGSGMRKPVWRQLSQLRSRAGRRCQIDKNPPTLPPPPPPPPVPAGEESIRRTPPNLFPLSTESKLFTIQF